ncbi:MAG: hypothetical protein ACTSRS_17715 [Candidatus Helarchaeota archaeon]
MTEKTAKFPIKAEEEGKLDKKHLILQGLGYASIIFLTLSLFFPYWNDFNAIPTQYISLWQLTHSYTPVPPNPAFHWEVLWYYYQFGPTTLLSGILLSFLIYFTISLIKYFWKRTFPSPHLFGLAIFLAIPTGLGFPLTYGFSFSSPYGYAFATPIYGPGWGLAFGWWALFIAGVLAIFRNRYAKMLEREKEEAEELGA